jgi:hypothetical protein
MALYVSMRAMHSFPSDIASSMTVVSLAPLFAIGATALAETIRQVRVYVLSIEYGRYHVF